MLRPTCMVLALFVALAVGPGTASDARASGISAPLVGTLGSGPAQADAAALAWNPAMLAWLDGGQVLLGAQLVLGDVRYQRERRAAYQREDSLVLALPVPPDALDPDRSGRAESVRSRAVAPVPAGFLAMPFTPGSPVVVGVGAWAPYAALVDYPDDGPQRWSVQQATIAAVHVSAGVGVRISDRVALGGSGTLVLGYLALERVQDFAAVGALADALERPPVAQENDLGPDAPPALRELAVLSRPFRMAPSVAAGFSFSLGASARVHDALMLGLAWEHGARLTFRSDFQLDMDDPFFTGDLASRGLRYDPLVEGRASFELPLPHRLRLGAAAELAPRWGLDLQTSVVFWNRVDRYAVRVRSAQLAQPELGVGPVVAIDLPRDWRATVEAEGTLRHVLRAGPELRLRLGAHTAASPDATIDASSPDGLRLVFGGGAVLPLGERWSLEADVLGQQVLRREVQASEHDLGNGRYGMTLLVGALHLGLRI